MGRLAILAALTCVVLAGCGAQTPDIDETVQAAVAATQSAQASRAPAAVPRTAMSATATETPTPLDTPESAVEVGGAILFVSESYSGTQVVNRDLYAVVGGQAKRLAQGVFEEFSLSPDGRVIANYGHSDSELQTIALDAGPGAAKVTNFEIPDVYSDILQRDISDVHWSPDSTRLAVRTGCSIYVLTLATGRFVEIVNECYDLVLLEAGPADLAWSPDGSYLAFDVLSIGEVPLFQDWLHGGRPAKLLVANADGSATRILDEHGALPVWSPDGRQILYRGGSRLADDGFRFCNERLYLISADGSDRIQLAEMTGGA